jgi:tetratricopeptide (TPR) repeat protein
MQTAWLIISGLLFVASTGLLFNDRFRNNVALVLLAALLAIGSTAALVYSFFPGGSSSPAPPPPSDEVADRVTNDVKDPANQTQNPPPGASCDWDAEETITSCLDRLRAHFSERVAMAQAFLGRGRRHYANARYAEAIEDFTVAIQNSDNPVSPIYIMRGIARIGRGDPEGALQDCNRIANPGNPTTLVPGAERVGAGPGIAGLLNTCRGVALSRLERHAEALPALDRAIEAGIADWHIYFARSKSRNATGNLAGGESDRRIWSTLLSEDAAAMTAWLQAGGNSAGAE